MILDTDAQYPISVTSNFDVETFDSTSKNYSIYQKSNSIMPLDKKNFTEEFYALRRKGLLKTIIKEFDVDLFLFYILSYSFSILTNSLILFELFIQSFI